MEQEIEEPENILKKDVNDPENAPGSEPNAPGTVVNGPEDSPGTFDASPSQEPEVLEELSTDVAKDEDNKNDTRTSDEGVPQSTNEITEREQLPKQGDVPVESDTEEEEKECPMKCEHIAVSGQRCLVEIHAQEPWPQDVKLYQPYEVEQILLPDNANCLAVQAFLKMCGLDFEIEPRSNAEYMSPSGRVPFIKCGAFVVAELDPIISFVNNKGISLSERLDSSQKADMRAYMSLVNTVLANAELYIMWCDNTTLQEVTKPRFGSVLPWPLNHIIAWQKRRQVIKKLGVLGWASKTLDEVYQEVDNCCSALSERLGNRSFFFGDSPLEFDAMLFGHLCSILMQTVPVAQLKMNRIVQQHSNLLQFVKQICNKYFPNSDLLSRVQQETPAEDATPFLPPAYLDEPVPGEQSAPADESEPVSGEQSVPTDESEPISGEQSTPTDDNQPISGEQSVPTDESEPVSGEQSAPADESEPVSGEQSAPADESEPVSGEQSAPADESEPVSGEQSAPADESEPVSGEQSAPTDGDEPIPSDETGEQTAPTDENEPTPGDETGKQTAPTDSNETGEQSAPTDDNEPLSATEGQQSTPADDTVSQVLATDNGQEADNNDKSTE